MKPEVTVAEAAPEHIPCVCGKGMILPAYFIIAAGPQHFLTVSANCTNCDYRLIMKVKAENTPYIPPERKAKAYDFIRKDNASKGK